MNQLVRMRKRPSPQPNHQVPVAAGTEVPDDSIGPSLAPPLDASPRVDVPVAPDTSYYAVGYARPPKAHQFKKGNRANPRGRPKGSKNLKTIIRETLEERIAVREGARVRKMTKAEIGIKKCINRFAETGDLKSLVVLLQHSANEPEQAGDAKASKPFDPSTEFVMAYLDQVIRDGGTLSSMPDTQPDESGRVRGGDDDHSE